MVENHPDTRKQEYREERRKQDTSNDDCRCAALFFVQRQRKRQNKAGCNTEQTFILTLTVTHSVSGTSSQQRRSFHAP